MTRTIAQRELRNDNAKVMEAVLAGDSFLIIRRHVAGLWAAGLAAWVGGCAGSVPRWWRWQTWLHTLTQFESKLVKLFNF